MVVGGFFVRDFFVRDTHRSPIRISSRWITPCQATLSQKLCSFIRAPALNTRQHGGMTKPRSELVDPNQANYYHVTSRCVRRAWLMGQDPITGRDYTHRKEVFLNRLRHIANHFSVEIMGYAIMSNHFHLVVHYDPNEADTWSDEEVAERWCSAFNSKPITTPAGDRQTYADFDLKQAIRYHSILQNPERLARCRKALGSLSCFMQHLKQPFALWANKEDGCTGHFFEKRFYSGALLTREDLLACMGYVDLNPVEAGMANSLKEAQDTSISERLNTQQFKAGELDLYLAPLWNERTEATDSNTQREHKTVRCTLREYIKQLTLAVTFLTHPGAEFPDSANGWMARLLNRERRRRANSPAFFDYT